MNKNKKQLLPFSKIFISSHVAFSCFIDTIHLVSITNGGTQPEYHHVINISGDEARFYRFVPGRSH